LEWFPERSDEMVVVRGVKLHHRQILLLLERVLGVRPECYRLLAVRQELEDYLEVWLAIDDAIFSDEIKELERLIRKIRLELGQELGVPVNVRLKERSSLGVPSSVPSIIDLRSKDSR